MLQRILFKSIAPALIIAVGLIALFWLWSRHAPPKRKPPEPRPPVVETIKFEPAKVSFEIRVGGNVVPHREVTISAQVAGTIAEKPDEVQSGRHVTQNTPLLTIDPAQHRLKVQEIASEIRQVTKDLVRNDVEATGNATLIKIAERQLVLATDELTRLKALKASVSQADLDLAEREKLDSENKLRVLENERDLIPIRRERLKEQLKLTRVRRRRAKLDLDRTQIAAPFDGTITHDAVERGNFVEPGDVLLKIAETKSVEVECNLKTDDLFWLWNSQQPQPVDEKNPDRAFFEVPDANVTVTYSVAGEQFHWSGRLARYESGGISRTTRTVPCRVIVSQPRRIDADDGPPALMRGMYVNVKITASPRTKLWKIPIRAVQPNGQVWTVEDGKLRVHNVASAKVLSDGVLIRADEATFKPGSLMIVSQLFTAFDGMQVRETDREKRSP